MTMNRLDPIHIPLRGVHLIEASAGTGKTYSITGLYIRLLVEAKLRPEEILVVTYTDAACKELRDAIRTKLLHAYHVCTSFKEAGAGKNVATDPFLADLFDAYKKQGMDFTPIASRLRLAITEFDLSAIYTIHGFCMRVLQDHAFESGFPFETDFVESDSELLQQVLDEFWQQHSPGWHPLFAAYLCEKQLYPETVLPLIFKLLKVVMVSGLDAIIFSETRSPESIDGAELLRLADLWKQDRKILTDELNSSAALRRNANAYRQDNLVRWFADLDRYFDGLSTIPPVNAIGMLSTTLLQTNPLKGKEDSVPKHEFFDLCEQISAQLLSAKNGLVQMLLVHCQQALQQLKLQKGVISFDDLLTGVRDALRRPGTGKRFAAGIGQKYPVALIDEFQDTDPVQYEIFKTVYQKGKTAQGLFLVGDPKQAIYCFRGADIFAYLAAAKANVDEVHSLTINWRSEPGLIEACNALFSKKVLPPFIIPEIDFLPAQAPETKKRSLSLDPPFDAPMTFAVFDDKPNKGVAQEVISRWLADQISLLLANSKEGTGQFIEQFDDGSIINKSLAASDIAILVRSHSEGELVKSALAQRGVYAVIQTRESVFHSQEARELELLLEAVVEPFNEKCLRAALSTRLLSVGVKDFLEMEEDERLWEEWLQRFGEYNQIWRERGVAPMLYELLNREKGFIRLSQLTGGERLLTNVRHLIELLQQVVHDKGLKPESLIKWMKDCRHDPEQSDASQIRLESDENLVQIVTIHKSKGLQYPVVFCPFLWDSRLTNSKQGDYVVFHNDHGELSVDYDTDSLKQHYQVQQKEELAEELRLLYVALTRAQHRCIINWGKVLSKDKCRTATSALQYLLNAIAGKSELGGNLVFDMQQFFEEQSDNFVDDVLADLSRYSRGNIAVVTLAGQPTGLTDGQQEKASLVPAKRFSRKLVQHSTIHSFSSLHSHANVLGPESPDYDGLYYDQPVDDILKTDSKRDMFSFPRGAQAGTCLHAILEEFDFQETDTIKIQQLVKEKLKRYGFEPEWEPTVVKFLSEMVSVELSKKTGLSLNQISRKSRLDELEFYYTVPAAEPNMKLHELFYKNPKSQPLSQGATGNFMKGFVDLIFQWNDQFFIVDYKSNFLGNSFDDYRRSNLKLAMESAGYDLQYRIYTIALHRYLMQRMPGYSYEEHFGGVYYLFLRGLELGRKEDYGVYFDRPEWGEIKEISKQLAFSDAKLQG